MASQSPLRSPSSNPVTVTGLKLAAAAAANPALQEVLALRSGQHFSKSSSSQGFTSNREQDELDEMIFSAEQNALQRQSGLATIKTDSPLLRTVFEQQKNLAVGFRAAIGTPPVIFETIPKVAPSAKFDIQPNKIKGDGFSSTVLGPKQNPTFGNQGLALSRLNSKVPSRTRLDLKFEDPREKALSGLSQPQTSSSFLGPGPEVDSESGLSNLAAQSKFLRSYLSAQKDFDGAEKALSNDFNLGPSASSSSVRPPRNPIGLDMSLLGNSMCVDLGSIYVHFPFEPYAEQKSFMSTLVSALDNNQNGLFESPTGTGKTLSLLSASLSWLRNAQSMGKAMSTKIFYASRTHAQLKQLVGELRTLPYRPNMCILASRDQLCIHKDLEKTEGGERNARCFQLISSEGCQYFRTMRKGEGVVNNLFNSPGEPLDIEDLCKRGESMKLCPFYASRSMLKDAHLVFLPYSYLTSPEHRQLLREYLPDSILLVDEAHNIGPAAEEGASMKLPTRELESMSDELQKLKDTLEVRMRTAGDFRAESLSKRIENIRKPIQKLRQLITGQWQRSNRNYGQGSSLEPELLFQFFHDALTGHLTENLSPSIEPANSGIDWRRELLTQAKNTCELLEYIHSAKDRRLGGFAVSNLLKWAGILGRVGELYNNYRMFVNSGFSGWKQQTINHFALLMEEKGARTLEDRGARNMGTDEDPLVTLTLKALSPAIGFKELRAAGPRSIIFTSGTLSPLEMYLAEFEIPFERVFRCGHVVDPTKQLSAAIVTHVKGGVKLDFSFENRKDAELVSSLGLSLVELAAHVRGGILLFFPSYALADAYYEAWATQGVLRALEEMRDMEIVKEPPQTGLLQSAFKQFELGLRRKKGAIFFAVCGGKLAEGIDFTDEMARVVALVGVPYPHAKDPHIIAKKKYLEALKQRESQLTLVVNSGANLVRKRPSGQEWYAAQAIRLANQALGRVLRHKFDYGAVLLLDNRFALPSLSKDLSSWLRNQIKVYDEMPPALANLKQFFPKAVEALLPDNLHLLQPKQSIETAELVNPMDWEAFGAIRQEGVNASQVDSELDDLALDSMNQTRLLGLPQVFPKRAIIDMQKFKLQPGSSQTNTKTALTELKLSAAGVLGKRGLEELKGESFSATTSGKQLLIKRGFGGGHHHGHHLEYDKDDPFVAREPERRNRGSHQSKIVEEENEIYAELAKANKEKSRSNRTKREDKEEREEKEGQRDRRQREVEVIGVVSIDSGARRAKDEVYTVSSQQSASSRQTASAVQSPRTKAVAGNEIPNLARRRGELGVGGRSNGNSSPGRRSSRTAGRKGGSSLSKIVHSPNTKRCLDELDSLLEDEVLNTPLHTSRTIDDEIDDLSLEI